MARLQLSDEQKERAQQYAKKKWPDEIVTVDDETNDEGEVIFRRQKTSAKSMPKGWNPPKSKKAR